VHEHAAEVCRLQTTQDQLSQVHLLCALTAVFCLRSISKSDYKLLCVRFIMYAEGNNLRLKLQIHDVDTRVLIEDLSRV
jgi:hypothetical protein